MILYHQNAWLNDFPNLASALSLEQSFWNLWRVC